MLSNDEIQALITAIENGTYGITDALHDIANAAKGEDVRKALYSEAYYYLREASSAGQPKPVSSASDMENECINYLYLGNETGYDYGYIYSYLNGDWTRTNLYGLPAAEDELIETIGQFLEAWLDEHPSAVVDENAIAEATADYLSENGSTLVSPWMTTNGAETVEDWLDEHPEATTTVQDGAITTAKLASDVKEAIEDAGKVRMSNILRVGTIFEKPDGLPYCGWAFNNLQYDPDLNAIVFLINAAVQHGDNGNTHLYMGVMNLDTYDVSITEIGDPSVLEHGFYTMGFCINDDGDYLYIDAQSKMLGKSTDKGETWTETSVSSYNTWPEAITQLSNGRYLFWGDGSTKGVWYSDDDCSTWTKATMSNPAYEGDFLELPDGVVMCFMRKSTNGTTDGTWNGTKRKEAIVISISEDYGETWTTAADSTTLLEGCANIATAFYHADEDIVEVFTSPRYPFGDTKGAIFQYMAKRSDALQDKFGTPKVITYAKALAYQDFGHIGGCLDKDGDIHLMYYDGDAATSGSVNYNYMKGSRGQAALPEKTDNANMLIPYSSDMVEKRLRAVRMALQAQINELVINSGGEIIDPDYFVTDSLKYAIDLTDATHYDTANGKITDMFGTEGTVTFTDGAISSNIVVDTETYKGKFSTYDAITFEAFLDVKTAQSVSDAAIVSNTVSVYDGPYIKGRTVKAHFVNTSNSNAAATLQINAWTDYPVGYDKGILGKAGLVQVVLVANSSGVVSEYINKVLVGTFTLADFASYKRWSDLGLTIPYNSIFDTKCVRVYAKALTLEEITQNYDYNKFFYD
ncbi:MAG: exo-alpha-sialidase [Ruminococcus sp.]|nr:exo-alpha-sialidase [Ruminococcus sp.]